VKKETTAKLVKYLLFLVGLLLIMGISLTQPTNTNSIGAPNYTGLELLQQNPLYGVGLAIIVIIVFILYIVVDNRRNKSK
jgi:uncharacterized BrkB/YihY/UPF0761 family membrane protein